MTPLACWRGGGGEASYHLDKLLFAQLSQHIKAPYGITFKVEPYRCGQNDSRYDAYRLHKILSDEGQNQRDDGSYQ